MICRKFITCRASNGHNCENLFSSKLFCIEKDRVRDSKIKCEENNRKYILENTHKEEISLYHMDGGIIKPDASVPDGLEKCDYCFVIDDKIIMTELKGVAVLKAVSQISSTLDIYKNELNGDYKVFARIIVTSSVPSIHADPKYVQLVRKIKRYNGNVKIWEREHSEKDSELDMSQ